jgi:hypothetical protein
MTSLIHRVLHSDLRPMLTSLTVLAFVAAPAFKVAIGTAGGHWN